MTTPPAERITPASWMTAAPTAAVLKALATGGATVRFVGGCVRDAILGLEPADIDIATPERPEAVIQRLRKAGLKAVPTGVEHGTVTAVVAPATFQITTLRRDVDTDGRHARVEFGTDWAEDALRRDFTINALYADPDGVLHDYTGGRADLTAGIVRFVGEPAQRVAEDYLRVLRFFRFHARFGKGEPHTASLAACAAAADRLDRLSAERIRDELLKILVLPNAAAALRLMQRSGVLQALLPEARFEPESFAVLTGMQEALHAQSGMEPDVWPRLALLFSSAAAGDSDALADRLRLSNAQRVRLTGLMSSSITPDELKDGSAFGRALYRLGAEKSRDQALLIAAREPALAELAVQRGVEAAAWRRPVFPLRGADILALGFPPGPNVSALLKELESWWAEGEFRADRVACLARLRERVQVAPED